LHSVAFISDIHGNDVALSSVLEAIEEDGIDRIICLGDVAATGPSPVRTISMLRESGALCVMGNTDQRMLNPDGGLFNSSRDRRIEVIDRWCAKQLGCRDIEFISSFNPVIRHELSGYRMICYHGSPRSNTEGIEADAAEDRLKMIFEGVEDDICAGGHTHVQMMRRFGEMLLINPGSVGLPYRAGKDGMHFRPVTAEFCFLYIDSGRMRVKFNSCAYEFSELLETVERSGMPERDWWLSRWKASARG